MFGQVLGACFEVVRRFKRRPFYNSSVRVKLILACQKGPKMRFDPQWTEIGCSSFKFKIYLRARTTKWKERKKERYYWYCMQIHQWTIIGDALPTRSPIELKHNTIVSTIVTNYIQFTVRRIWKAYCNPTEILQREESKLQALQFPHKQAGRTPAAILSNARSKDLLHTFSKPASLWGCQ